MVANGEGVKRESIAIGSDYLQILDLADKAFKVAIINKFEELKEPIFKHRSAL